MTKMTVKQARGHLSELLDQVANGEEIEILRRGKRVARLVPSSQETLPVPDLKSFRKSLQVKGKSLSKTVIELRQKERY